MMQTNLNHGAQSAFRSSGIKYLSRGFSVLWILLLFPLLPARAIEYKALNNLSGHVLYSPDGKYLLRYENTLLQFWDLKGQKLRYQRILKSPIIGINFTPDGKQLASGHKDGSYIVWKSANLTEQLRIHDVNSGPNSQPFALSPDGAYLTLCKTHANASRLIMTLHVWDLRKKKLFRKIPLGSWNNALPGHAPAIELAYHPLGRYLSVAIEWMDQTQPKSMKVWDTWKASWSYWLPASPPIKYSPDGHYFAFTEFNQRKQHWQVRLWHTPTNLLKQVPLQVAEPLQTDIVLSKQGRLLVVASETNYQSRTLSIIDTRTLKTFLKLTVPKAVDSYSFSQDERFLLLSSRHNAVFKPLIYTLPKIR